MRSAQPLLRNRELTARWSWICKICRWLTCHLQHHGAPLPAVSREPRGDVRGHLPLPRHFSPVAHSARWVPPLGEDPRRLQGGSTLRWWAERDVVPPPTSLPSPRHPRHGHPGSHHSAFFFFLATAKPPDGRSIANRPPPPVPVQDGVWGGAAAAPLGTPATGAAGLPPPPGARRWQSLLHCRPVSSSTPPLRVAGGHSSPPPPSATPLILGGGAASRAWYGRAAAGGGGRHVSSRPFLPPPRLSVPLFFPSPAAAVPVAPTCGRGDVDGDAATAQGCHLSRAARRTAAAMAAGWAGGRVAGEGAPASRNRHRVPCRSPRAAASLSSRRCL